LRLPALWKFPLVDFGLDSAILSLTGRKICFASPNGVGVRLVVAIAMIGGRFLLRNRGWVRLMLSIGQAKRGANGQVTFR